MSDLAKKCADYIRKFGTGDTYTGDKALAAFIERAQALRAGDALCGARYHSCANCDADKRAYDAALRDLAQSMEVE